MLDQQKISLYRLKQAYCLNEYEARSLLHELSPDGVYPYEFWQKAYSSYWQYPAAECARIYNVENPSFPEVGQQSKEYFPTETYAKWIVDFFFEMARRISVKSLESGFDYIIESTYDNKFAINDSDREYLFYHLMLADKNMANVTRTKGVKDIDVRLSSPEVLLKIYPDTIAVDKMAAIHFLSIVQQYPFNHEVKGITYSLVDSIVKTAEQGMSHAPQTLSTIVSPVSAVQHQEQGRVISIPTELWEGKSPVAIRNAMKAEFDSPVIAYVLMQWCGVTKTQAGRLLSEKQFEDEKSYRNLIDAMMEKIALVTICKG